MKYYLSEIGNIPLEIKAGDKAVTVQFEALAPLGGVKFGVYKTDDKEIQTALDEIVGSQGLRESNEEEYDTMKKKVVSSDSLTNSPQPISMSPPSPAVEEAPSAPEVELEDLTQGSSVSEPAPTKKAAKKKVKETTDQDG
jgi:hypothetical protein